MNDNKSFGNFLSKPKKGFSRRHETPEPMNQARRAWEGNKSREAKRAYAKVLKDERAKRSPEEQLALLDSCPGNATRERKRLHAMIATNQSTKTPVEPEKNSSKTLESKGKTSRKKG